MSRTEELRQGGARDRTGGGTGDPFIRWPKDQDYAWIEGRLRKIWEGKFGESATLTITATSDSLMAEGRNEAGEKESFHPGVGNDVNVGLNSSALMDTLSQEDVGENVHIAFEGWAEAKNSGNQYRIFTVLILDKRSGVGTEQAAQADGPSEVERDGVEEQAASYVEEDDPAMPF